MSLLSCFVKFFLKIHHAINKKHVIFLHKGRWIFYRTPHMCFCYKSFWKFYFTNWLQILLFFYSTCCWSLVSSFTEKYDVKRITYIPKSYWRIRQVYLKIFETSVNWKVFGDFLLFIIYYKVCIRISNADVILMQTTVWLTYMRGTTKKLMFKLNNCYRCGETFHALEELVRIYPSFVFIVRCSVW